MINYFKELLNVLKSIDKNVKRIADCVREDKMDNVNKCVMHVKNVE